LDEPGIALLARYPGWLPSSSHFFPLFNTIGTVLNVVNNGARIIVVVQGLTGDPVAEKGRKMARFALVKSIVYRNFFDEALEVGLKSATTDRP
jgi:hypothetical protein